MYGYAIQLMKQPTDNLYSAIKGKGAYRNNEKMSVNNYTLDDIRTVVKKIYIIGPVGSGKSTFSKKLSKKYGINYYELDKVSWDDENGNIKRSEEEALKLFNDILKNESWIIEDIGREIFERGKVEADIIYYIRLQKIKSYFRVTKRWIKQRIGKEPYNCPPTFKQLLYFISTVNSYYQKEKSKLKGLEKYSDKLIFINNRDINSIINKND